MNRMIRISAIVIATAIAASNLTSPASAQPLVQAGEPATSRQPIMTPVAVLSGTPFHQIRQPLRIADSRRSPLVPERSIVDRIERSIPRSDPGAIAQCFVRRSDSDAPGPKKPGETSSPSFLR